MAAFVAAAAFAGLCAPALAQDKPVFGLVMSFSGWFQPIDADTIAGAKLAVEEINAAGGVLGQPIEIVEFDNKSEPPLGADGAVEVIGKGAKAILFPSDFDFGAPGAYVAQQSDVIAFSGASDPKFGVQGVGPLAYSTSNASQAQGALLAEWAFKDKGWKTAYVLLDNTIAYTKSLCASMGTRWKELAGDAGAARRGHVPERRRVDRGADHAHHQPADQAGRDLLLLLRAGRPERDPPDARRRHRRARSSPASRSTATTGSARCPISATSTSSTTARNTATIRTRR